MTFTDFFIYFLSTDLAVKQVLQLDDLNRVYSPPKCVTSHYHCWPNGMESFSCFTLACPWLAGYCFPQREMTEHTDRRAERPSQVVCVSEDLKCWGAWDTACGHKAKAITPLIAWRTEAWKEEVLEDLPCKDEIRWTLELFQRQHWGKLWAHRYHLELNWTEPKPTGWSFDGIKGHKHAISCQDLVSFRTRKFIICCDFSIHKTQFVFLKSIWI